MKKNLLWVSALTLFISLLLFIGSCKKNDIVQTTTGDVNIVGYLDKFPDSFSLFRQILDRTETAAYLNAYGAYTCFAPTNSGVKTYLQKINAASVEAADLNTLKDMVRLHLLEDTLFTGSFTDGKLPIITMYGQYLITSVTFSGGLSTYIVNRQANIVKTNVRVGNGVIHVIDNVLIPATKTISEQLAAKPEYSIFVQALQATGFYTLLNTIDPNPANKWLTVFAESNQALADSGITSYNQLRAKYSQTGNPLNANDSLNMYVAYHISPGLKYLGDIIAVATHETKLPQEVVSIKLINQEVILNQDVFNGVLELGIKLTRSKSDVAATNGVWHDAKSHFMVKFRKPTALYWDVSSFEEIMKLPAYYKRADYTFVRPTEADKPIKDHYWGWGPLAGTNALNYVYSVTGTITNWAYNNDVNVLPLGLPNRPIWWEMKTPPIVKGRYKVWLCYRSQTGVTCQVTVNGELMQRTQNFSQTRPAGTDGELEAIGYKRYTENTSGSFVGRQVGVVDFTTTQQQTIRLIPVSGTNNANNMDMIHFIPVAENQILPRFRPDGTKIFL